jgi:hypothetical protein
MIPGLSDTCAVMDWMNKSGLGYPCSERDRKVGNLVRIFWGSNEICMARALPVLFPGIMSDYQCCDVTACNGFVATNQSQRCSISASPVTAGYCAGRTFIYSVCSQPEDTDDISTVVTTVRLSIHKACIYNWHNS